MAASPSVTSGPNVTSDCKLGGAGSAHIRLSGLGLDLGLHLNSILRGFTTASWNRFCACTPGVSPEGMWVRIQNRASPSSAVFPWDTLWLPGAFFPNPLARNSVFLSTSSSRAVTQLCTARSEKRKKRQGELPHTLLTTGPLSSAPLVREKGFLLRFRDTCPYRRHPCHRSAAQQLRLAPGWGWRDKRTKERHWGPPQTLPLQEPLFSVLCLGRGGFS